MSSVRDARGKCIFVVYNKIISDSYSLFLISLIIVNSLNILVKSSHSRFWTYFRFLKRTKFRKIITLDSNWSYWWQVWPQIEPQIIFKMVIVGTLILGNATYVDLKWTKLIYFNILLNWLEKWSKFPSLI